MHNALKAILCYVTKKYLTYYVCVLSMKQLRDRVMKLREDHDHIYHLSRTEGKPSINWGTMMDDKLVGIMCWHKSYCVFWELDAHNKCQQPNSNWGCCSLGRSLVDRLVVQHSGAISTKFEKYFSRKLEETKLKGEWMLDLHLSAGHKKCFLCVRKIFK